MSFFDSVHCTSRAHCDTCRSIIWGRKLRESIKVSFGTDVVDFECPNGIEWKWSLVRPSGCVKMIDEAFERAKLDTLSRPDDGLWADVRNELRLVEKFIADNRPRQTECWERRQKERFVGQYTVALTRSRHG